MVQLERSLLDTARVAGVPVPEVVTSGDGTRRRPGRGMAGGRAPRGRDHPAEDPARPRVGRGTYGARPPSAGARWRRFTRSIRMPSTGCHPADPLGDPLPYLDLLGEARPALELGARWLRCPRACARVAGDRARRFPARQPAGRSRRPARCPRLGAGPRRRPRGGHRVVVRSGLALRGRGRGRRLREPRRSARRVRGRGWRGDRRRPRPLVAGLRHGEVGDHLRAAGLGAPERRHALGGAGRHRAARLRERVGPLLSVGGGTGRSRSCPSSRSGARCGGAATAQLRSVGRRRPSSSKQCASTSRPG